MLEKISEKYQAYSGSKRRRDIKSSINYFKDQIEIFKKKSIISNQKLNNFADKYDLLSLTSTSGNRSENAAFLNIERSRTQASSNLSKINELFERIKLEKNKPESVI